MCLQFNSIIDLPALVYKKAQYTNKCTELLIKIYFYEYKSFTAVHNTLMLQ